MAAKKLDDVVFPPRQALGASVATSRGARNAEASRHPCTNDVAACTGSGGGAGPVINPDRTLVAYAGSGQQETVVFVS
jgi:hypothetical protein